MFFICVSIFNETIYSLCRSIAFDGSVESSSAHRGVECEELIILILETGVTRFSCCGEIILLSSFLTASITCIIYSRLEKIAEVISINLLIVHLVSIKIDVDV